MTKDANLKEREIYLFFVFIFKEMEIMKQISHQACCFPACVTRPIGVGVAVTELLSGVGADMEVGGLSSGLGSNARPFTMQ